MNSLEKRIAVDGTLSFFLTLKMTKHSNISDNELMRKIKQQEIRLGGNIRLKIYGTLHCKSGKRMKRENRVFFSSENEAIASRFRPCGCCMRSAYEKWKTKK